MLKGTRASVSAPTRGCVATSELGDIKRLGQNTKLFKTRPSPFILKKRRRRKGIFFLAAIFPL
jgi:hypothetical protein